MMITNGSSTGACMSKDGRMGFIGGDNSKQAHWQTVECMVDIHASSRAR